jgi:AcrR family transcriptional regulator
LIEKDGHESVTIAKVAKSTGIPESSILYHFPTRDHLLVAAMKEIDDLGSKVSHVEDENFVFNPEEFTESFGDRKKRSHKIQLLYVWLRGQATIDGHPAQLYFRERDRRARAAWNKIARLGQAEGKFRGGLDPEVMALQILALWDGLNGYNALDAQLDIDTILSAGIRMLTGTNWQEFKKQLDDPEVEL